MGSRLDRQNLETENAQDDVVRPFLPGCPRRDDYDQGRDDASASGRCGDASNRNRDRIRAEYSGEIGQVADPRHP
jgi:hypothetical protein